MFSIVYLVVIPTKEGIVTAVAAGTRSLRSAPFLEVAMVMRCQTCNKKLTPEEYKEQEFITSFHVSIKDIQKGLWPLFCNQCQILHFTSVHVEYQFVGSLIHVVDFDRLCALCKGELEVPDELRKRSDNFELLRRVHKTACSTASWQLHKELYKKILHSLATDILGRSLKPQEIEYLRKKASWLVSFS